MPRVLTPRSQPRMAKWRSVQGEKGVGQAGEQARRSGWCVRHQPRATESLSSPAAPPRRLLCAQISRQPLSPRTANGGEGLGAVGGERRKHKRKRPWPRCLVPVTTTQCRQQPDGTYTLGRMTAALQGRTDAGRRRLHPRPCEP